MAGQRPSRKIQSRGPAFSNLASDRRDEFGLARLEAAILAGGRLADRSLIWHSSFEE